MAIHSPSEVSEAREGEEIEVGGRVLRKGEGAVIVGDALAQVEIVLEAPGAENEELEEGDLAVFAGRRRGDKLERGRVLGLAYSPRSIGFEVAGPPHLRAPREETRRFLELGLGARLKARSLVLSAVRRFFTERRYLEVETPQLVRSPGLDLHLDAFEVGGGGYLGTSPEYHMKRLLAGGLPRIFQITHCFRQGELGRRHNPEFTMLEWYRAWASVDSLMDETEALVRAIAEELRPEATPLAGGPCDLFAPFLRMTVAEAFERFAGISRLEMLRLSLVDEERWFRLLVEEVEPGLAGLGRPVFLHRYPMSQASLARTDPSDGTVAERFELYVGELELCNGFGELTHPLEQRGRLLSDQERRRSLGKPVYPLDERFLAALSEGMPPAAGNALGLDRLVALALGAESLEEVLAFPEGTS